MNEQQQYAVGDKVKLGQALELESTYEVVAVNYDGRPDLVLIRPAGYPEDHPGVWPWVAKVNGIRPVPEA